ncbi:MAG: hypothetical protein HYV09_14245 [Deltaproteobacteria bacterium]|nr:hypothetical protein [Deltaproteobacteria bacterium]
MAGQTTFRKRDKERARQERQKAKEVDRKARKEERAKRTDGAPGEDPDIAGIVPGPQPISEG